MKYRKGQIIKIERPISCIAHTIPSNSTIRICAVNRILRTYDIEQCDDPSRWIDDVSDSHIVGTLLL